VDVGSSLFIIAGMASCLFFARGRGIGFVLLGTGFFLLGLCTLVNNYLPQILNLETRLTDTFQISSTLLLMISGVISSILILGGLFFLYKESAKKK
jgi:hypothetical protein